MVHARCCLFPLASILFASSISTINAQDLINDSNEIDSFLIAQTLPQQRLAYSVNVYGKLFPSFIQSAAPEANLNFFEDDDALRELELTPTQESDLRRIVKDWRASLEEMYTDESKTVSTKKFGESATAEDAKALEQMQDVLLPHQFAAIHRLQFRCLVRNHGFRAILENKTSRDALEISQLECERVAKVSSQLRTEVRDSALALKQKAIDVFLQPLTPAQRKIVIEKWPELESKSSFGLDQFQRFLEKGNEYSPPNRKSSIDEVVERRGIELGVTGKLRESKDPWRYYQGELDVFRDIWSQARDYQWFNQDIEQIKEISFLLSDCENETDQMRKELFDGSNKPESRSFEERASEIEQTIKELRTGTLSQIKSMLGTPGWEQVEQVCAQANERLAGPLHDMLEGELSEELKLTEPERSRIKSSAEDALELLIDESNKVEELVHSRMIDVLDDDTKEKIQATLGKPMKHSPARLELIAMFL